MAAVLVMTVAACNSKSEADQATEALNAGLQAHVAGNLEQASTQYKECLKHDAANKLCLYNLGLIAQTQGRAAEAENYYRLALATDANYAPALFNLAILRTAASPPAIDEAIGMYRQVLITQPENAAAHLNLGLLLLGQGKTAEGNASIATAVRLDPTLGARVPQPSSAPSSPASSPGASAGPKASSEPNASPSAS